MHSCLQTLVSNDSPLQEMEGTDTLAPPLDLHYPPPPASARINGFVSHKCSPFSGIPDRSIAGASTLEYI